MDPQKLSVSALRSVLSEYGVEVPAGSIRKAGLVELFESNNVNRLIAKRKNADKKLAKRKRSSIIPDAEVDVVPRKKQRISLEQEDVTTPPKRTVRRRSARSKSPTTRKKRQSLVQKQREEEEERRRQEVAAAQATELRKLKRQQAEERKRIERRQSEEIAAIAEQRRQLEQEKEKMMRAMSERDVSMRKAKPAKKINRRATASPRRPRTSLLPALTPENTRRRTRKKEEEEEEVKVESPPRYATRRPSIVAGAWPTFPDWEDDEEDDENEEDEEPVAGLLSLSEEEEEDEDVTSPATLFFIGVGLLVVAIGIYAFLAAFPFAVLPYCQAGERENCVPCPAHAVCDGMSISCQPGYEKKWRRGHFLCVEDLETPRLAKSIVTHQFRDLLRRRKGQRDCGQLNRPVLLEKEGKLELATIYKKQVGAKKAEENFEEFYREVQRLMATDKELPVLLQPGEHGGPYYTTTATPIRPLGCAVRLFLLAHLWKVAVAAFLAAIVGFKLWERQQVQHTKEVVLKEVQRARLVDDAGVAIVHLRDSVAPDSLFKQYIWGKVCQSMEQDSRVGRTLQLLRGEHQDVWEWEAPI